MSTAKEIEVAIEELKTQRESDCSRKRDIEVRFTEIKALVRRRLDNAVYRNLCDEQAALTGEMADINNRLSDAKIRMHRLQCELTDAKAEAKANKPEGPAPSLLAEILAELKTMNGHLMAMQTPKEGTR